MRKQDYLAIPVQHIDYTAFDATPIIQAMRCMSFTARDLARAAEIYDQMLQDPAATIVLALAGSTGAAGCLNLYADLIKHDMVDVVVATGASIVDMDFFEALGFRHYQGSPQVDDVELRALYIDRIYDTLIDEEQLRQCDRAIKAIADALPPGVYSARGLTREMGRWLKTHAQKKGSLLENAYDYGVPIFCPAFSDSSAGFGLTQHQVERPSAHVAIDSVKDFRELTMLKIQAEQTGLLIIGGGVPKNFIQDTVVCAEVLGHTVPMHKYAIQITVADARDGACSSSTLREAQSWGKVDGQHEQMVYAEATCVLPLLASYAYHQRHWQNRPRKAWNNLFAETLSGEN